VRLTQERFRADAKGLIAALQTALHEADAAREAALEANRRQEREAVEEKRRQEQEAAEAKHRQEQEAAEARRRQEQEAAEAKRRQEQEAVAEKRRQEQAAAEAKRRQEQEAAEARRRQQELATAAQAEQEVARAERERVRRAEAAQARELARWDFVKASRRTKEFLGQVARLPGGVTKRFASVRPQDRSRPRIAVYNNPKVRGAFYQVVLLALVLWAGYEIVFNVKANLEARRIATGLGFLNSTAGFSVSQSLIPYHETHTYGRVFVVGLLNTLLVSVIGIVLATMLGFGIGLARLSSNWLVARLAGGYIEVVRNLPLLFQILFWYLAVLTALPSPRQSVSIFGEVFLNNRGVIVPRPFAEPGAGLVGLAVVVGLLATVALAVWARRRREATGRHFPLAWTGLALIVVMPLLVAAALGFPIGFERPQLRGFNFVGGARLVPEFVALLIALVTYTAGFIAEVVRAGILAVSRGQTEAALALGLRRGQALQLVIIPQALRVIIPPLTSQYLNLTKNSSLAVAIGYPDLVAVFASTTLNQTGQAVEIIAITMAVYLTISLVTSALMNWYNARIRLVER
jgi:general L-amino acid transport system permease protein